MPCGNFPRDTKAKGGKVSIVNLQTTKQDRICGLRLWAYCDEVMTRLCLQLGVEIPGWDSPRIILYSKHTGEKEKKDNSWIIDKELDVIETEDQWQEYENRKEEKPKIKQLSESRSHLIKSVELPGLKRESGMGDIAAAAAIAAEAVRRIPSPTDPAPAPPSDDEDAFQPHTMIAAQLNTLPMAGALTNQTFPTMNVQQIDAAQIMQHMQPGQMLTVTQLPTQPGQQPQHVSRRVLTLNCSNMIDLI